MFRSKFYLKLKLNEFHYYSDGLMYNPVNMVIEDEDRLNEKDVREKNKKKRYEIRYDAEVITRKEMLAE